MACAVDVLGRLREFCRPGINYSILQPFTECGVALYECALITAPLMQESVFHVEHSPIEQAASTRRALVDQSVHARIDHLDGKNFCDVCNTGDALAAEPHLGRAVAVLRARDENATGVLHPSDDSEVVLATL